MAEAVTRIGSNSRTVTTEGQGWGADRNGKPLLEALLALAARLNEGRDG